MKTTFKLQIKREQLKEKDKVNQECSCATFSFSLYAWRAHEHHLLVEISKLI